MKVHYILDQLLVPTVILSLVAALEDPREQIFHHGKADICKSKFFSFRKY